MYDEIIVWWASDVNSKINIILNEYSRFLTGESHTVH